jgi:valyl-tRNA synthetase
MAAMETQGRDINLSDSRIQGYRNFATKLWNAARFCEMNECYAVKDFNVADAKLEINKWIIAKAKEASKQVTENLDAFRFSDAANSVYQFVWGTFCDWYIELIKPVLYGENAEDIKETRAVAAWTLDRILTILHPFMPFVTTELWNNLNTERNVDLIRAEWPLNETIVAEDKKQIDMAIEFILAIRSLRSAMNLPAGAKLSAFVKDANAETLTVINNENKLICTLARLQEFAPLGDREVTEDMAQTVCREATILIPLKGVIDFSAERERLQKELETLNKNLLGYAKKLGNESFVAKAPAAVVAEEKRRQQEALENKTKVEEALARIANF